MSNTCDLCSRSGPAGFTSSMSGSLGVPKNLCKLCGDTPAARVILDNGYSAIEIRTALFTAAFAGKITTQLNMLANKLGVPF